MEGTVLSLCVCVWCLCVTTKLLETSIILISKQATSHKLGNLRRKVVLLKTSVVFKIWKEEKQILHERFLNQVKGTNLLET